ncbi:sensor histidine kinase [Garciella nitratireducens]|uniref:histidine kinase n=1 Tax=Garciella nitratireducens DSM 15102 TaxID=1121911 RepID=A0A1T4NCX2_9FIRM|nr:ATP-binding protein [Garciella nitratireducens]RBP44078.1 phospho-acceptor domain-containing protein [Garciella nitratireducens]SJZ76886.1 His Kinase A (phospho-acceptor) domain-containing protein [Garciella nitratireducens DSM 15102]
MLNKLRLNLTVLNTIVLILILSIIAVFVYILMFYNLHSGIDDRLISSTHQIENYVNFIEKSPNSENIDLEEKNEYLRILHNMIKENISYVVWDRDQDIYSSYRELEDHVLLEIQDNIFNGVGKSEKIVKDLNRIFYFQTVYKDGISYRICTTQFSTDSQSENIRTIQTVKSLKTEKEVLNRLGLILFCMILVGATLSLIGGYILAGRSLIPVIKSWKRQQEFVADASHELRTPLAVVQTNLEVIKDSPKETIQSQSYWLNNAYEETLRMKKLIDDLLFLARIDSGENPIQWEKIDLSFLIQDVNEKLIPLASNKKIQIIGDIEENVIIQGDSNKLRQLLVILLDNAIKYSPPNTIILVKGTVNKHDVKIEVIDQGIGMKQEDVKRVFDRFYRSDKARSREQGGTGLGLSIAKWIVDMHRGKINIESNLGEGTKVIVQLPFR